MRQAFIKTLEKLAEKDERIILLTADLGFTVFENFRKKFPKQFYNLGVGESNMIGMASGLALSGKIPLAYSIANFAVFRPYEFIRNDVCYQNVNVKIVGVGGGLGYASAGFSHCNYEDLSVLRPLPNLTILSPSDPVETEILTKQALKHQGPVYLRLGKVGEPGIHLKKPKIKLGKGLIFKTGKKIAIFSTGSITDNVIQAINKLKQYKLDPTLVIMPTIKPLDKSLIIKIVKTHQYVFSVEEHSIIGGLGSAIAETISEAKITVKFKRLGITNTFQKTVGSQEFLRNRYGLSVAKLTSTLRLEK